MNNLKLNKSDFKLIGGYLLIVTLWLTYRFTVEQYALREYLVDIPVALIQVVLLLLISKRLIEYYFIKRGNLMWFITIGFLSLWLISFLTMLSGDFTKFGRIPWEQYGSVGKLIIFNINNSIFNIAIPLSLISGKKYYEHQLNTSRLINTQKELELKILRSQFDPHFLYNSLNTIDALVDYSSKETIKKYISNLASLYRYLVMIKDEEIVKLEDEVELGKNYLFLTETRFESHFDVHFDLNNLPMNKFLPNGAFLTVIENVIKHNKARNGIKIRVEISVTSSQISIKNSKSLQVKSGEYSKGIGLENLKKQYKLLSNKEIIIHETESYFSINLPLLTIINKAIG